MGCIAVLVRGTRRIQASFNMLHCFHNPDWTSRASLASPLPKFQQPESLMLWKRTNWPSCPLLKIPFSSTKHGIPIAATSFFVLYSQTFSHTSTAIPPRQTQATLSRSSDRGGSVSSKKSKLFCFHRMPFPPVRNWHCMPKRKDTVLLTQCSISVRACPSFLSTL